MLSVYDSLADNQVDNTAVNFTIQNLTKIMTELISYSSQAVTQHMLLDTGAPCSIRSEQWLRSANWSILYNILNIEKFTGEVRDIYISLNSPVSFTRYNILNKIIIIL